MIQQLEKSYCVIMEKLISKFCSRMNISYYAYNEVISDSLDTYLVIDVFKTNNNILCYIIENTRTNNQSLITNKEQELYYKVV